MYTLTPALSLREREKGGPALSLREREKGGPALFLRERGEGGVMHIRSPLPWGEG